MKKHALFSLVLISLMFMAISAMVYAQDVSVQIGTPSYLTDLGIISGSYWIGEFPITINPGSAQQTGEVYCLTPAGTVYEGQTYNNVNVATVPDTQTWEAISYILTWDPPTDGTSAAVDQVAIWDLIGQPGPYADFTLDPSILTSATNLAASVEGLNVAHQGDTLTWISPASGSASANPGETVTFQLQLTAPRQNVQIDFTATLTPPTGPTTTLSSSDISPTQTLTDSNGQAEVTVTVPSNAQPGSTITVEASTMDVWPQEYLDLTTNNPGTQNLIGITPELDITSTATIAVSGYILVLPESAIGALSAIIAFAASFVVYYKLKEKAKLRLA